MKKIIYLLSSLLFSIILLTNGQTSNRFEVLRAPDQLMKLEAKKSLEAPSQYSKTMMQLKKEHSDKKKAFMKKYKLPDVNALQAPGSIIEKYSLDSLNHSILLHDDWVSESKEQFEYNEKGQLISSAAYNYDSETQSWVIESITSVNYNDAGQITFMQNESWDEEKEHLVLQYKVVYDYDERGNTILEEGYQEDYDEDSNEYREIGSWKSTYEYDLNDNEILYSVYVWDMDSGDWINYYKIESLYADDGIQLMGATFLWLSDDSKWVGISKFEYEPVPRFSQIIGYAEYSWDYIADDWMILNQQSYEVTESQDDIVVTSTVSSYSYEVGELVFTEKDVFSDFIADTFDSFEGSFGTQYHYEWDAANEQWLNITKLNIQHHDNWYLSEYALYNWRMLDESMQWVPVNIISAQIDENGQIENRLNSIFMYDEYTATNTLVSQTREIFIYENDLPVPSKIEQELYNFATELWQKTNTTWFTYDEEYRITHQITYNYDDIEMEMEPYAYYDFEYNANGTVSLYREAYYDKLAETFVIHTAMESYEDEYGNLLLDSYGTFDFLINDFYWHYRNENTFDSNRNLIMRSFLYSYPVELVPGIEYSLQTEGYKYETLYNDDGFKSAYIESEYNNDIKDFEPIEILNIHYLDGYPGAFEYEIYQERDDVSGELKFVEKRVLSSNLEILGEDLVLPFQRDDGLEAETYFNYMPEELLYFSWNDDLSTWIEAYKTTVYFNLNQFTGTKNLQKDAILIYPNPAFDYVVINTSGKGLISLYDMQGRKIYGAAIENQTTINISNFAEGVYFYQIETNNKNITGKLMKR